MPERVQLSRAKGWKMPPNTVKVDRSTLWGNVYRYPDDPARAVNRYRHDLETAGAIRARVTGRGTFLVTVQQIREELGGKNLACWCRPGAPCHADVLLEIANQPHNQGGSV